MKIKDKYPEIIKLREAEEEMPWEDMKSIKATIALFTANLQETIDFLDNGCTADQFSWMSEVFDEISEKLQSWDFIDTLRRTAAKYPEETRKYNVLSLLRPLKACCPMRFTLNGIPKPQTNNSTNNSRRIPQQLSLG